VITFDQTIAAGGTKIGITMSDLLKATPQTILVVDDAKRSLIGGTFGWRFRPRRS
jgi:hypothetical protein